MKINTPNNEVTCHKASEVFTEKLWNTLSNMLQKNNTDIDLDGKTMNLLKKYATQWVDDSEWKKIKNIVDTIEQHQ